MKTNIITIIFLSTSLIFSGGCKKFLAVNSDPNNAHDVTVQTLLPSAETGLTYALGNTLSIDGGIWSQFWTQNPLSSQYKTLDQYSPSEGDFGNVWFNMEVDALENFQKIIQKGNANNHLQYVAIATILKAYTFQLSTDLWGDVPFSQALQGDSTPQILTPVYDKQSDIYAGLVKLVDSAINIINTTTDPFTVGNEDLIYQGDMGKWLRFANTLKLKIGIRLAKKDPATAAAIIQSLAGADFIHTGESALQNFTAVGGQQNPLYGAITGTVLQGTQNLVASLTTINFFDTYNDPREGAFYSPLSNGAIIGIAQGSYANPTTTTVSSPSAITGGNASDPTSAMAPVRLMTDYEASFLQAEAAARGWLTGTPAATLYNQGITNNFVAFGLQATDASTYYAQAGIAYPAAGTVETQVQSIITQKWAAMCGNQNIEAWTEWRRTGYPSFFTISQASIIGANRFPGVFLYPTSEMQRNPNAPKTNHLVYDKVWWAQ